MITPNILTNVGQLVIWKGTVQNGPTNNTGVQVDFTIPSDFSIVSANLEGVGTLDTATGIWTVGDLAKGATICFELVLALNTATQGFDFDYDFVATVTGIDTLQDNNRLEDVVNYKVETCDPMGASNDSTSGCLCVDVSQYGTPCSEGVTEYRLNVQSIENGTNTSWDNLTGLGDFTAVDPTLPVIFTYDTYCVQGGQEYQISCDTQHIITPQLEDKDVFNHTIESVDATDLTAADVLVLEAQYPNLVVADYCWHVIKNADGDVTSGLPLDCSEDRDTRTEFSCSDVAYSDGMTIEETSFEDPEKGDNLIVAFTNGTGYFNYVPSVDCTAGTWELCSFVPIGITEVNWSDIQGIPAGFADDVDNDTISPAQAPTFQSIAVTGTTTKTITVTLTDGSMLTADFEDLQGMGATTLDWANITNKPAGFADDVDNDTISPTPPVLSLNIVGNQLQLLSDGVVIDSDTLPTSIQLVDDGIRNTIAFDTDNDGAAEETYKIYPGNSVQDTLRGIVTTGNNQLFFPKTASQEFDELKEIGIYGLNIPSNVDISVMSITGGLIPVTDTYSSADVKKDIVGIDDVDKDGYVVTITDSGGTTTASTHLTITLYYE